MAQNILIGISGGIAWLLVHAILLGGGYGASVLSTLRQLAA